MGTRKGTSSPGTVAAIAAVPGLAAVRTELRAAGLNARAVFALVIRTHRELCRLSTLPGALPASGHVRSRAKAALDEVQLLQTDLGPFAPEATGLIRAAATLRDILARPVRDDRKPTKFMPEMMRRVGFAIYVKARRQRDGSDYGHATRAAELTALVLKAFYPDVAGVTPGAVRRHISLQTPSYLSSRARTLSP